MEFAQEGCNEKLQIVSVSNQNKKRAEALSPSGHNQGEIISLPVVRGA